MQENRFEYTYTAPTEEERREINSIRRQYGVDGGEEENKMERLRRLHARVKRGAVCLSLSLGIFGCLTFGVGMTMVLEWGARFWGVVVSAVGAIPMGIAYPLYKRVLKRNKAKYGGEIVRLSDELLSGKE